MKIQLNKAHFPVTTLGPGRRIGLWFQGCHVRCPGCMSRDTWQPDPSRDLGLDLVVGWCRSCFDDGCDGVTISGGEPFEQPTALAMLLDAMIEARRGRERPIDLLCYSGLPLRRLRREHREILARLDALIPQPFVAGLPGKRWRGSANQPLLPLTPLGRRRYAQSASADDEPKPAVQAVVGLESVWLVGVPRAADLEKLRRAAERRGVLLGGLSWRR